LISSIVRAGLRDDCVRGEATKIKHHRVQRERPATYPENPWRVDGDEVPCELGFVRRDELPRGVLGERLRGEVDSEGPRGGTLTRHRGDGGIVPARLVVIARRRASSRTAATEEVKTTRLTPVQCFSAEFRIDVVPRTAGTMSSVL